MSHFPPVEADRYRVLRSGPARTHLIWDYTLHGACSLPDSDGRLIELRFAAREQARDWLQLCRRQGLDMGRSVSWPADPHMGPPVIYPTAWYQGSGLSIVE